MSSRLSLFRNLFRVSRSNIVTRGIQYRNFAVSSYNSSSWNNPKLPNIDSSKILIEKTKTPKQKIPKEELKFGGLMSDHMLVLDWNISSGWSKPSIIPYQPLQIDPAASCLHYALECFEGMKAYIDSSNSIRLFRPELNMKRMNSSAERLLLPQFNGEELIKCIAELIKVDKDWIPRGHGYSMYIRPTLIGTHPYLGVQPSLSAKLYVILSPVGPYYPEGFNPITLYADTQHVRAWPGGTGAAKVGGNYALGIRPALEASAKGYSQILWLFGEDLQVTEVGTMNQFFFWKRPSDGAKELITAPLDGTILPGVTRQSIIELAKEWDEFIVTERKYTLKEVISACKEGRMIEAFGAGTAAIVCPVKGFNYNGNDYSIPLDSTDPKAKAGKLTQRLADKIMEIQYGKIPNHPWSRIVK